jgi:uncharacterized protein (DUF2267 family)
MQYDEMVEAVAEAARVDREQAATALAATLEVLGQRIGKGEREDLASELPEELKRIVVQGDHKGESMSLHEFLARVAELEGSTWEEARRHASAVFRTLSRAVSDGEMKDVFAQLPREYRSLLVPPPAS